MPRDAVATPEADQDIGLERMRGAGALLTSTKALYYEWLRGVSRARAFRRANPDLETLRPPTLVL